MTVVPYHNKYFRISAAFIATLFVLFQGRPFDLYKALSTPLFYGAFVVSFLVALLIVYIIHRITLRLDQSHPWNADAVERLVYQIILCLGAPLIIDFIIFAAYHMIRKENIFLNRFFPQDFLYTSLLLLLLNIYYYLHARFYYWRSQIKLKSEPPLTQVPTVPLTEELQVSKQLEITDSEVITIKYKRTQVHLLLEDIHCFYKSGKNVRILTADKNNYTTPESISSLEARYRDKGFFLINREVMVSQKIVKGYQSAFARDTLKLLIKQKYSFVQDTLDFTQLTVTKDHIEAIKAAFRDLRRIGKNFR